MSLKDKLIDASQTPLGIPMTNQSLTPHRILTSEVHPLDVLLSCHDTFNVSPN